MRVGDDGGVGGNGGSVGGRDWGMAKVRRGSKREKMKKNRLRDDMPVVRAVGKKEPLERKIHGFRKTTIFQGSHLCIYPSPPPRLRPLAKGTEHSISYPRGPISHAAGKIPAHASGFQNPTSLCKRLDTIPEARNSGLDIRYWRPHEQTRRRDENSIPTSDAGSRDVMQRYIGRV